MLADLRGGTAGRMPRIVIFEPSASGHQMYHVRLIIEAAQQAGLALTLATTEAALADSSAAPLHAVLQHAGTELLMTRPQPDAYAAAGRLHPILREQFVQSRALQAALRSHGGRARVSHVFVPFFDGYMTLPLGLRMDPCLGIAMSGILHRTRFHMPAMGVRTTLPWHKKIERYVYASMLRRRDVGQLFTMDPYLDRYYGNGRVTFLPDPGAHRPGRTREAVRDELGIRPDQLCILVHGALDSRKAIGPLLQAVHDLADPRVCVVLAGRQDSLVRDIVSRPPAQQLRAAGRLCEITGFLADQQVDDLLQASDVCWICYLNSDGNSGVLMKAGQAGRPVITADTGISARAVEDDHIGWQATPTDPSNIAHVIAAILADPAAREAAGRAIRSRFSGHTVENFVTPIVEHFRRVAAHADPFPASASDRIP